VLSVWERGDGTMDESTLSFPWSEYTRFIPEWNGWSKWRWIRTDELPSLMKYAEVGVFHSIWEYERMNLKSRRLGDLYFDFDKEGQIEVARQDAITAIRMLEQTYGINPDNLDIGFSGKKGFYFIIPREIFLVRPIPRPEKVYKDFAETIKFVTSTLDPKPYKVRGMWRVTNSSHQESRLFRIPLSFDEISNLKIQEILQIARQPRTVENSGKLKFNNRLHDAICGLFGKRSRRTRKRLKTDGRERVVSSDIPAGVSEGERNDTIFHLTCRLIRIGKPQTEALDLIFDFNKNCNPPLGREEVKGIVQNAYRRYT
jgi:hypothetical protein